MSIFHGGSYKTCRELTTNPTLDCHHLISRAALLRWYDAMKPNRYNKFLSYESQNWAPAIVMTHSDHMRTLSYCGSDLPSSAQILAARDYIDDQAERLIQFGDIVGVLKDEAYAIKDLFGSKYKSALREMWSYFYSLNPRITGTVLTFTNPNIRNFTFHYDFSFE